MNFINYLNNKINIKENFKTPNSIIEANKPIFSEIFGSYSYLQPYFRLVSKDFYKNSFLTFLQVQGRYPITKREFLKYIKIEKPNFHIYSFSKKDTKIRCLEKSLFNYLGNLYNYMYIFNHMSTGYFYYSYHKKFVSFQLRNNINSFFRSKETFFDPETTYCKFRLI